MGSKLDTNTLIGMSPTILRNIRRNSILHDLTPRQAQDIKFLLALHALRNLDQRVTRAGTPLTDEQREKIAARMYSRLEHALAMRLRANQQTAEQAAAEKRAAENKLSAIKMIKDAVELAVMSGTAVTGMLTMASMKLGQPSLAIGGTVAAFTLAGAAMLRPIRKSIARHIGFRGNTTKQLGVLRDEVTRSTMDSAALEMVKKGMFTDRAAVRAYQTLRGSADPSRPAVKVIMWLMSTAP